MESGSTFAEATADRSTCAEASTGGELSGSVFVIFIFKYSFGWIIAEGVDIRCPSEKIVEG